MSRNVQECKSARVLGPTSPFTSPDITTSASEVTAGLNCPTQYEPAGLPTTVHSASVCFSWSRPPVHTVRYLRNYNGPKEAPISKM